MKKFNMIRDINGYNSFGLSFSDSMFGGILLAGAEQTLTVPNSPFADYPNLIAVFSFPSIANIWVSINQTAVVPTESISQINAELNPKTLRYVKGGDIIHFITSDTSDQYGVIFYAMS